MALSLNELNQLYLAYFGRPVDVVGLTYFANRSIDEVVQAFDASEESLKLYGTNPVAKIHAIYNNLFNRDAELEGLSYWTAELQSGRVTAAEAAIVILQNALGTDARVVANKLAAANAFARAMDTQAEQEGYQGEAAAASARAWLKSVGVSEESALKGVQYAPLALDQAILAGRSTMHWATAGADAPVLTLGSDLFVTRLGDAGEVAVQKIAMHGPLQAGDAFVVTLGDGTTQIASGPLATGSVVALAQALQAARGNAGVAFSVGTGADAGHLVVTYAQPGAQPEVAQLQQTAVAGSALSPGLRETHSITLKGVFLAGDAFKVVLPDGTVLVADQITREGVELADGGTSMALGYAQDLAAQLNEQLLALQGAQALVEFRAGYVGGAQSEYPVLQAVFTQAGPQSGVLTLEQTYIGGVAVTSANQSQVMVPEYAVVQPGVLADAPAVTGQSVMVVQGDGGQASWSSLTSLDVLDQLVGFVIGRDKIVLQTADGAELPAPHALTRVADVGTLAAQDLPSQLAQSFGALGAHEAGLVVVRGGSAAGTYVYVNDGDAAFSWREDVFVALTGVSGSLGGVGDLPVSDFFLI